jgi:hypothetical protein
LFVSLFGFSFCSRRLLFLPSASLFLCVLNISIISVVGSVCLYTLKSVPSQQTLPTATETDLDVGLPAYCVCL